MTRHERRQTFYRAIGCEYGLWLDRIARQTAIERFRARHPLVQYYLMRETKNRRLEESYPGTRTLLNVALLPMPSADDWSEEDQERWEALQGAR